MTPAFDLDEAAAQTKYYLVILDRVPRVLRGQGRERQ